MRQRKRLGLAMMVLGIAGLMFSLVTARGREATPEPFHVDATFNSPVTGVMGHDGDGVEVEVAYAFPPNYQGGNQVWVKLYGPITGPPATWPVAWVGIATCPAGPNNRGDTVNFGYTTPLAAGYYNIMTMATGADSFSSTSFIIAP